MDSKTEKRFMEAMTKTLHAYEKVIEAGEWSKDDWSRYGRSCRICDILRDCSKCPLNNCADATYFKLYCIINISKEYRKSKFFKDRYKWLIAKIEKAGYDYK